VFIDQTGQETPYTIKMLHGLIIFNHIKAKMKKYVLPEKKMLEVSKFVRKKFSAYLN
jgi:hypothetical protein